MVHQETCLPAVPAGVVCHGMDQFDADGTRALGRAANRHVNLVAAAGQHGHQTKGVAVMAKIIDFDIARSPEQFKPELGALRCIAAHSPRLRPAVNSASQVLGHCQSAQKETSRR